jgi:hypothetical protein
MGSSATLFFLKNYIYIFGPLGWPKPPLGSNDVAGHPNFFSKNFLLFFILFSFKKLINILLYIKWDTWRYVDSWIEMDGQDDNMRLSYFSSNMRGSRSFFPLEMDKHSLYFIK